ncbi:hypothetical protein DNTS_013529, partial [Danionella cerebrum]
MVCKDPPYKVEESGYAGFILPIEVYFKNKEEPKKVRFDYDLFLHLEGHPPVNHLRCEKLTFNNPTEDFRRKLLKAGGQRDPHKRSSEDSKVMVMQEGATSLFGQHLKLPTLPSSSLTLAFSETKKSKPFPVQKEGSKSTGALTTTNISSSSLKLHKPMKDHKEQKDKPSKDSKESKSAFRDFSKDSGKLFKDSKKPKENQPIREDRPTPQMGFKEPKSVSKEPRPTEMSFSNLGQTKRRPVLDSEGHVTKKRKSSFSESSQKQQTCPPIGQHHHLDKKVSKDNPQIRHRANGELLEKRKPQALPPFQDVLDPNDSDMDDNSFVRSDQSRSSAISQVCMTARLYNPYTPDTILKDLQLFPQR